MSEKTPADLNTEYKLGLSPDQIREFARLGGDEAVARLQAIGGWLSRVNVQNHDGVTVTPALSRFLAVRRTSTRRYTTWTS